MNKEVTNGYANLRRLKPTAPFSQRLNDFINDRAEGLRYIDGAFPELSFEEFKAEFKSSGVMPISNEHCENNIFGDIETNIAFRAWHDSIHLELNEGFEYFSEAIVAFKQMNELPLDWVFERNLIYCEVIGQAAYHRNTGNFVEDQREFTINFLESEKF